MGVDSRQTNGARLAGRSFVFRTSRAHGPATTTSRVKPTNATSSELVTSSCLGQQLSAYSSGAAKKLSSTSTSSRSTLGSTRSSIAGYWSSCSTTSSKKAHGSGMVHITRGNFEATPVPVPPLAEQELIVAAVEEHFSRLDFAEIALEAARSKLRALRQSVLAAAFSGRLTNPTHTTNTDPDQLPGGWRWTALHDLLEHTIGGAWGKPIDEDDVNVRVLRVTEFGEHTVLEPETGVVRAVSAKQLASRRLQLGDILLEKSGGGPNQPVGRVVAFRTHLAEPAVPTNFVQLLRPSRDAIDPAFLTWTLDWWHKNGIAEAHQRATNKHPKPPDEGIPRTTGGSPPGRAEQEQVVATIEEHFSVLNAAETALDALRAKVSACRRSVLVEAFAGRLVPQDPGDEPAMQPCSRASRPSTRRARPAGREPA